MVFVLYQSWFYELHLIVNNLENLWYTAKKHSQLKEETKSRASSKTTGVKNKKLISFEHAIDKNYKSPFANRRNL